MQVIRKQEIDTEWFKVGDEIHFKLASGEEVGAKAVQDCAEGMLFITDGCVGKDVPMYKRENIPKEYPDYLCSDLRKYLNTELLSLFPEEIRTQMLPMQVAGDYLGIPSEKEIFGEDYQSTYELHAWRSKQFYGMEHRRNRIVVNNKEKLKRYWLQNSITGVAMFAYMYGGSRVNYSEAYEPNGVRLVFLLKNKPIFQIAIIEDEDDNK